MVSITMLKVNLVLFNKLRLLNSTVNSALRIIRTVCIVMGAKLSVVNCTTC